MVTVPPKGMQRGEGRDEWLKRKPLAGWQILRISANEMRARTTNRKIAAAAKGVRGVLGPTFTVTWEQDLCSITNSNHVRQMLTKCYNKFSTMQIFY